MVLQIKSEIMRSSEPDDPLQNADIGETVTVRESKTIHSIDITPNVFFGDDRFTDVEVSDVEIVEGAGESGDIRITWEGDVTKQLPSRWDYHADPVTEEEKREARRKRRFRIFARVASIMFPIGAATIIAAHVFNKLAESMVVNGQPIGPVTAANILPSVAIIMLVSAVIIYGLNGGLPRGRGRL